MKKWFKYLIFFSLAGVLAAALVTAHFYQSMNGGFGERQRAEKEVARYLAEQYPAQDLVVESLDYSYKREVFLAKVQSLSSRDTYFEIMIQRNGKIQGDTYEDIEKGYTTYSRLSEQYREIWERLRSEAEQSFSISMSWAQLQAVDTEEQAAKGEEGAIVLEQLVLDREYNMEELAAKAGKLWLTIEAEEVSYEKLEEIVLKLKELCREKQFVFASMDIRLEQKSSEEKADQKAAGIQVKGLLYQDIYPEGLLERLQKAK